MKVLKFKGVEVLTNVGGKELSDPAFAPFWKKAEELGALVLIHPNGFTHCRAFHALLLQQRDRQSAGDHCRAALP
jgi:aminocarboxymuconate-semialdehyde decarboxylase